MNIQKVEMTVEQKENGQYVEQVAYPFVEYDHVAMENGMDIMSMIRDDVSTPMVTHNTASWKVGQGDSDVSESIVDSSIASMTIKGQTYQNILPSPSLRNSMTNGKTMQKLNEGYDSVNTVDGVCKSAILKGCTGYRDIDTGEILETFEDGRNLELVSVKMPVLTSVSSTNLYVMDELLEEKVIINTFENSSTDFINVYPNEKIFFSTYKDYNYARFYDDNKQPIGDYIMIAGWNPVDSFFGKSTHIVPENGKYLKVFIRTNRNWEELTMVNRGEDYLPYEKGKPYKSNILSCNEEVTLRGIGDVKDTLDLTTSELTQRIGEVVLDGSEDEDWILATMATSVTGYTRFYLNNTDNMKSSTPNIVSDKLPYMLNPQTKSAECIGHMYNSKINIVVSNSRLNEIEVGGFRQWLSQNPITVQYELAEPITTTIDLKQHPFAYKDGYVVLTSSGEEISLTPTIEYSLIANRLGQIQSNQKLVEKQQAQIDELESMVVANLVNTQYQQALNEIKLGVK